MAPYGYRRLIRGADGATFSPPAGRWKAKGETVVLAVVRSFLAGVRIEKATRQAVLRWYCLPRDLFLKLVELRGIEPLTPRLPASCSPS